MKRLYFILLTGIICIKAQAQSQISVHFPLICSYVSLYGYVDGDSIDYYDPPMPFIWAGDVKVRDGFFGNGNDNFHLREGFMKHYEGGMTFFQISLNLYQGIAGVSSALQFSAHHISLDRNYMPYRTGDRIEFETISPSLKKNDISYYMFRFPVLAGIQTRNRYFSIQTGPSFEIRSGGSHEFKAEEEKSDEHRLHVTHLGINWHVMANAGPFTIAFTQSLVPAFQLTDGTDAYTRSLTVGFNICFFHSVKSSKPVSKRRKAASELF